MKTFDEMLDAEKQAIGEYVMSRGRELAKFEANREVLAAGMAAFKRVEEEFGGADGGTYGGAHYVWAYLLGSGLQIYASNLKSFGEVGPYLKALRAALPQFKIEERMHKELEYSCKIGPFSLTFQVSHSEATCRKVQVGTETKEVPVYKIVCDGQSPEQEELGPQFGEVDRPLNASPDYGLHNNPSNGGI